MKCKSLKIIVCIIFFISILFIFSATNENVSSNKPEVYRILPERGYVGNEIAVYGKNFGDERNDSEVFFGDISCQDYDFDYVYWSDNLIKIKVPTGANSDYIKIKIDNDVITGPYFKSYSEGSHIYSNPMEIVIDYTLNVTGNSSKPLYVWLPSSVPSDKQRTVSLLGKSENHTERARDELDMFKIDEIQSGSNYEVSKRFSFQNYQLNTKIDPEKVTSKYDTESEFYKYYTTAVFAIESDDPRIIHLAESIVGEEENPYLKAKYIYQWIINNVEYQYPPPNRDWRAICAIRTRRGDCAVYSFLFTALCRAVGVPARPVAGHVLFLNDVVSMHYWTEFYIPKYGWIPVDANYGDVQVNGFLDKEEYFGSMDNRHIAFSKGRVQLQMPIGPGGQMKEHTLRHLQKFHSYIEQPGGNYYRIRRSITRVVD